MALIALIETEILFGFFGQKDWRVKQEIASKKNVKFYLYFFILLMKKI
jgi:hypothetical protein